MILKFSDPEGLAKWVGEPQRYEVDLLGGIDDPMDIEGRGPLDFAARMSCAVIEHERRNSTTSVFLADESAIEAIRSQIDMPEMRRFGATPDSFRGIPI